jgi:copper chaperone CopZ
MTSATYHVAGMTCEHCARAVTAELAALDGVSEVSVDLVPGGTSAVTVVSTAPVSHQDVEAALDEAGDYRIVASADGTADVDEHAAAISRPDLAPVAD